MEYYPIIEIKDVWKAYQKTNVLEGVNITIPRGSVFGILGRNGAGKTTLMECLVGLRTPDKGDIKIFNKEGEESLFEDVKDKVGVQPQEMSLFQRQTVKETFELFSSMYKNPMAVSYLLSRLKLDELKDKQIKKLSTGQKQRVYIGVALVGNPNILLLDEPTAGLDVQVRMLIWDIIKEMRGNGKTILITTHYMEEAEELCDQIAILHEKKIVTTGPPIEIVKKYSKLNKPSLDNAFINLTGSEIRLGVD